MTWFLEQGFRLPVVPLAVVKVAGVRFGPIALKRSSHQHGQLIDRITAARSHAATNAEGRPISLLNMKPLSCHYRQKIWFFFVLQRLIGSCLRPWSAIVARLKGFARRALQPAKKPLVQTSSPLWRQLVNFCTKSAHLMVLPFHRRKDRLEQPRLAGSNLPMVKCVRCSKLITNGPKVKKGNRHFLTADDKQTTVSEDIQTFRPPFFGVLLAAQKCIVFHDLD